jgi:uncharacterized protein YcsI (UPF0317 family)
MALENFRKGLINHYPNLVGTVDDVCWAAFAGLLERYLQAVGLVVARKYADYGILLIGVRNRPDPNLAAAEVGSTWAPASQHRNG